MYMNKNVVVEDFITGSKMTKLKESSKSIEYIHMIKCGKISNAVEQQLINHSTTSDT